MIANRRNEAVMLRIGNIEIVKFFAIDTAIGCQTFVETVDLRT
jgi:hypothetical protein